MEHSNFCSTEGANYKSLGMSSRVHTFKSPNHLSRCETESSDVLYQPQQRPALGITAINRPNLYEKRVICSTGQTIHYVI